MKYYQLKKNLSKKELASRVQVSSQYIADYESGLKEPPFEIKKTGKSS